MGNSSAASKMSSRSHRCSGFHGIRTNVLFLLRWWTSSHHRQLNNRRSISNILPFYFFCFFNYLLQLLCIDFCVNTLKIFKNTSHCIFRPHEKFIQLFKGIIRSKSQTKRINFYYLFYFTYCYLLIFKTKTH